MFTGLVEELGTLVAVRGSGQYRRIEIEAPGICGDLSYGDSVNVDGACQTVTEISGSRFAVDTLAVTLEKTTLGELRRGSRVNLERAVTPSTRLGGHFVQGHVDGTARVSRVSRQGENIYLEIILPDELARYCVSEGSIAVAGVSLTVARLGGNRVTINIIPTTWKDSNLAGLRAGSRVNIETDVLGRYVERFVSRFLEGEKR